MFKHALFILSAFMACVTNAAVLIDVPGSGSPYLGCTPQCTQAISLLAPYNPADTLYNQVDNAGVADGNSIVLSQTVVSPVTDKVTHIQWNGKGDYGYGFIIGVWDSSVPATIPTGMPGFGTNPGTKVAMLNITANKMVTSAAINGMTHYDAKVPAFPLVAGHRYYVSIASITGGFPAWQWETSAAINACLTSSSGCFALFRSSGAVQMTIGGVNLGFAPMAFQFSNDTVVPPPAPPAINTSSLPGATIGSAYTAPVNVTYPAGDTANTSVTGLPTGLGFDGANIVGIPSQIGTFPINVTATDATTGLTTSAALSLTVADNVIAFTPANLADAPVNAAYTATITPATGGYGAFTYTATGLPAGLTLTGTTLSGTPTVAGAYTVNVTATDSVGTTANANLSLNVIDPVVVPTTCSGTGVVTAYAARSNGFIVVNGGVNLLDHLWISGLNPSNTVFNGGLVNWYQTGLVVSWTGTVSYGCVLDHLTVSPRITISTSTLPDGVAGNAYSAPITSTWGASPYTTTVLGLPAGLSFDGSNIVGIPTAAGSFTVSVNSMDSYGVNAAATLALTITAPPISSFSANLPQANVGTVYSATINAAGGYGALTYSATGLPAGLSLTGNSISGTPTAPGTFALTLTATDALGTTRQINANLIITNYTVKNNASGIITAIGADYLMIGTKKIVWNSATTFKQKNSAGKLVTVKALNMGLINLNLSKAIWTGMLDKTAKTVLASTIRIN